MKIFLGNFLLVLVFIFTTVTYAISEPEWIDNKSKKYPESLYIIGVGIGDTLDASRSASQAEIAKIFQLQITQSISDFKKESFSNREISNKMSTEINTKVTTEGLLEGVEIAETYFDEKKNIYYALAILNKGKMSKVIAFQILEQEVFIQTQVYSTNRMKSPLEKTKALTLAIKAANKREELINRQRIIDIISMPTPNTQSISLAELQKRKSDELKKIHFVIISDNQDNDYNLINVINEKVTKLGFNIDATEDKVINEDSFRAIIKCRLNLEPVIRPGSGDWKFYNWQVVLEMREKNQNGNILTTDTLQGQVSNLTDDTAKRKAVFAAKQETSLAIEKMINNYILAE